MSLLRRLFGRLEHGVTVYLDGVGLPDEIYEQYGLSTIEDQLIGVLARSGAGRYDGNEFGPGETALFLCGHDSERLLAAVEPVLREYPLCRGARVVLHHGSPEAPARELRL